MLYSYSTKTDLCDAKALPTRNFYPAERLPPRETVRNAFPCIPGKLINVPSGATCHVQHVIGQVAGSLIPFIPFHSLSSFSSLNFYVSLMSVSFISCFRFLVKNVQLTNDEAISKDSKIPPFYSLERQEYPQFIFLQL